MSPLSMVEPVMFYHLHVLNLYQNTLEHHLGSTKGVGEPNMSPSRRAVEGCQANHLIGRLSDVTPYKETSVCYKWG